MKVSSTLRKYWIDKHEDEFAEPTFEVQQVASNFHLGLWTSYLINNISGHLIA